MIGLAETKARKANERMRMRERIFVSCMAAGVLLGFGLLPRTLSRPAIKGVNHFGCLEVQRRKRE